MVNATEVLEVVVRLHLEVVKAEVEAKREGSSP